MPYTKLEAASIQLDRAIELFLQDDHLCALTLAGAAEDILGGLCAAKGMERAIDFIATDRAPGSVADVMSGLSKREVINELNRPRNSAKHGTDPDELVDADVSWAAQMLMRAIPMARDLGHRSTLHDAFNEWVKDHPEVTDPED